MLAGRVLIPCAYAYLALYVQDIIAVITPARCVPFHTTFSQGSVGEDSSSFIPYRYISMKFDGQFTDVFCSVLRVPLTTSIILEV